MTGRDRFFIGLIFGVGIAIGESTSGWIVKRMILTGVFTFAFGCGVTLMRRVWNDRRSLTRRP